MGENKPPSDSQDTRKQILAAATHLFAINGFASTGVRKVAQEAQISLSMVNYHFGSKQKMLEEIIAECGLSVKTVHESTLGGEGSLEERVRAYVDAMTELILENPDRMHVMVSEVPRTTPEMEEHKADSIREGIDTVRDRLLPEAAVRSGRSTPFEIVVPLIHMMVMAHFIHKPTIERISGTKFGESFYESYADHISDLLLYGLVGKP
ncbi:MAG: TetR/AcrR family transcriptional regulator [Candidatus Latescibacteria bacterium]|jgi:AcrR family transcriptional regulator|nr:TetR/AcrR family transcriptional regulator [Candidatus Latescibacterota bacterium]